MGGFTVWVTVLLLDIYFGRALTLNCPCEIRGNVFSLNLLCLVFKRVLVVCPLHIGCPYIRALSTNLSVCVLAVCMCVCHCESSDGGAVPAILCDHEGRGSVQQFSSHFVKSISAQLLLLLFTSLVSSQWDHYAMLPHLSQDGTQHPAVFDCFHAGPNSVVWLESVFLMDFFY